MENKSLRSAIIGYGYMGEIRRQVIERRDDLELVGVCEPNVTLHKKLKGY